MLRALRGWLLRVLSDSDLAGLRLLREQARLSRTAGLIASAAIVMAAISEGSTMGLLATAMHTLLADAETPLGTSSLPMRAAQFLNWRTDRHNLFLLITGMALMAQVIRSMVQLAGATAVARMDAAVEGNVRSRIFEYFMLGPFADIRQMKHGQMTSYMDQVKYVGAMVQQMYLGAGQATICLAYVCVLCWISPLSTLGAVVALALMLGVLRPVLRRVRQASVRHMKQSVELAGSVNEYLGSLRQIRLLGRETLAIEQADVALEESIEARRKSLVFKATLVPSIETLAMVFVALLLSLASGTLESLADLAPVVTFAFIFHRMLPRLNTVIGSRAALGEYWPFVCRVAELQNHWSATRQAHQGPLFTGLKRKIELRNIAFRYESREEQAVSQVSFALERGKVVALVGRSGSGKTTLADLLLRLYEPHGGEILVDGVEYRTYDAQLGCSNLYGEPASVAAARNATA